MVKLQRQELSRYSDITLLLHGLHWSVKTAVQLSWRLNSMRLYIPMVWSSSHCQTIGMDQRHQGRCIGNSMAISAGRGARNHMNITSRSHQEPGCFYRCLHSSIPWVLWIVWFSSLSTTKISARSASGPGLLWLRTSLPLMPHDVLRTLALIVWSFFILSTTEDFTRLMHMLLLYSK